MRWRLAASTSQVGNSVLSAKMSSYIKCLMGRSSGVILSFYENVSFLTSCGWNFFFPFKVMYTHVGNGCHFHF